MAMLSTDPRILGLALLMGIAPALAWLWFWIREEGKRPEPRGLLTIIFLLGMVATIAVLPIQKFIQANVVSSGLELIAWAAAEELIKFLAVIVLIYKTNQVDEATDWPIYMITAALGFAALENALFLLKPLSLGEATVGLLTGQLRFLGSTLLHAVSSAFIGIAIGLSLHSGILKKALYVVLGIISAIALHSAFNFFIIEGKGEGFLKVAAFLWVISVLVMLLFEKLRRMD